jgi:hypothetical protein
VDILYGAGLDAEALADGDSLIGRYHPKRICSDTDAQGEPGGRLLGGAGKHSVIYHVDVWIPAAMKLM